MTLNHLVTVVELSSSGIRLVSGYEENHNLVILFSGISEPLEMDEVGNVEKQTAIHYLTDLTQKAKNRLGSLGGIILLLPPNEFEIKTENGSTTPVSMDGTVSLQDYRNCVAIIEKSVKVPENKVICDISPISFSLDTKAGLTQLPINQKTRMLDAYCDIQLIDKGTYDFGMSVLKGAGLSAYLTLVTTVCASNLMLFSEPPVKEYLTLNIDRGYCEIGHVSNGRMLASHYLNFGIQQVISIASKALGVTKKRAEELLDIFGIQDGCGFPYFTDEKKSVKDISQAFEEGLDGFLFRLKEVLSTISPKLEVLLYGPNSHIPGLESVLMKKMNRTIHTFNSQYLGARDQEYINCLGGVALGGGLTYQRPAEEDSPLPQVNPTMGFHR